MATSPVVDRLDVVEQVGLGFGPTCSGESAGEIGAIERFGSEASLALYLGMAVLDHSSGTHTGTKRPRQVNTRAKAAMMIAVARHKAPGYSMRSGRAIREA